MCPIYQICILPICSTLVFFHIAKPQLDATFVIFDDVIITSKLHSDKYILKVNFTFFSKTYRQDNVCQK